MIRDSQFEVIIQSKSGTLAQKAVNAISSINEKGVFDILPNHANFISLIKNYVILHIDASNQKEYKFTKGVMQVFDNKVNIYVDIFSN